MQYFLETPKFTKQGKYVLISSNFKRKTQKIDTYDETSYITAVNELFYSKSGNSFGSRFNSGKSNILIALAGKM